MMNNANVTVNETQNVYDSALEGSGERSSSSTFTYSKKRKRKDDIKYILNQIPTHQQYEQQQEENFVFEILSETKDALWRGEQYVEIVVDTFLNHEVITRIVAKASNLLENNRNSYTLTVSNITQTSILLEVSPIVKSDEEDDIQEFSDDE